jgi:hypothetical protein
MMGHMLKCKKLGWTIPSDAYVPHIHQSQNKVLGNRVFVTLLFESLLHIPIVLVLTLFILFLQRSYCLHTDSFS